MTKTVENRYDFVYLFDVTDANPNGDPDQGNLPRIDPETQHGLVTDICIKRKVRDYILYNQERFKNKEQMYDIFIQRRDAVLNDLIEEAAKEKGKGKKNIGERKKYLQDKYYDIRTFGAVMSTGGEEVNAGTVRGPVQFSFARSVDRIYQAEHSITRCTVATPEEAKNQKDREYPSTMGRKYTVPYALYRMNGYINAHDSKKAVFSEDDLSILFEALKNAFENDASAARGPGAMVARVLIIFKHDNNLGRARSSDLFELISISKKDDIKIPRSFDHYNITLNRKELPKGVTIDERSLIPEQVAME
jgi:CRISPR-associated protein Csd2